MNPNEIRSELKMHGYNFSIVADVVGVSRAYVAQVALTGKGSHRVKQAIAAAIDRSVDEIFTAQPVREQAKKQRAEKVAMLRRRLDASEAA